MSPLWAPLLLGLLGSSAAFAAADFQDDDDSGPPRLILPADDDDDQPGSVPTCRPESRSAERVRVLLMDLKAPESRQRLARALGQVIAEEASAVPGFQLLSTDELRAILQNDAEKAMAGCTDSECLADLASALDAELLISGSLDVRPGAPPTLSLSLVNTRALVTVNRVIMSWAGDPELLPEVARTAAQRLVFEGSMRKPGMVFIDGLPDGALVAVDDVDFTDELEEDTLVLPVGPYRIRISAPDHESAEELVLVQAGQETVVDGALLEIESNSLTWIILGSVSAAAVVLAGGIVTAAVLTGGSSVSANAQVDVPTLANAEAAK